MMFVLFSTANVFCCCCLLLSHGDLFPLLFCKFFFAVNYSFSLELICGNLRWFPLGKIFICFCKVAERINNLGLFETKLLS